MLTDSMKGQCPQSECESVPFFAIVCADNFNCSLSATLIAIRHFEAYELLSFDSYQRDEIESFHHIMRFKIRKKSKRCFKTVSIVYG